MRAPRSVRVSLARARFRSAPSIASGGPVMTVGKKAVTPVECSARIDAAMFSSRRCRRVVIHSGEAVDLQVYESRG